VKARKVPLQCKKHQEEHLATQYEAVEPARYDTGKAHRWAVVDSVMGKPLVQNWHEWWEEHKKF
jgi:hypothetical protein